jgi:hypothetical protein
MTNETNALTTLFIACWKDADLKVRFMSNPKAVLDEYGMKVPEGVDVTVVENTDNTIHITLPAAPDSHMDLSDDELTNAAGGWYQFAPWTAPPCEFSLCNDHN